MLNTKDFFSELQRLRYSFYSGVPCSFMKSLINFSISECDFVMSSNEGDAVAASCGAALAGKKSVVLMQNSGLTNATSPLSSLNWSFTIPVLGFVSLRGEPSIQDEPQHQLMGKITADMLRLLDIEYEYLSDSMPIALEQLQKADAAIAKNKTFFFIVKKGVFDVQPTPDLSAPSVTNADLCKKTRADALPSRFELLQKLHDHSKGKDMVLLATTGKTGRELYEVEDAANNLYMVGSMGCVSSLGLGLSMNTDKKIIAIDGDGALLMRMGNMASNAAYAPPNFLHLLVDNASHASTGGQFTVSPNIDFVQIAASVGYASSIYIHSLDELQERLEYWYHNQRPTFMYIKVSSEEKEKLGRPSVTPAQVKARLMEYISG